MLKTTKIVLALFLIPQYLLVRLLSNYPEFIERFYSNGLYPYLSKFLQFTLDWIPFSFGDLVYAFGFIYAIFWFYKTRKRILKDTKNWFIDIIAVASVIHFVFYLFWGMNYYRLPLHKHLNLKTNYTTKQLVKATKQLIEQSNKIHLELVKNDTLKVDFNFTKAEILELTPKGYKNLKHVFPNLKYYPKSVKKSMFSFPLSYMGFSGYLNPFTNEAQVSALIPKYKFPTTASHEIAHQLGYAAENEANFIGCLAAINHNNIYFKYAGYTFGLRYCLHEIYRRDKDLYKHLVSQLNKGILKNYKEVRTFWEIHQNPMEPFFKLFYDNFLKANKQNMGIKSYSYVVALITNYFVREQ